MDGGWAVAVVGFEHRRLPLPCDRTWVLPASMLWL